MTWSITHQVIPVITFLLLTFVSIVSFRRGDRRHGQVSAYFGSGTLLMHVDRLMSSTPPWIFIAGALLMLLGGVIYFGRFHSLIDWRRYPKPVTEPDPE